MKPQTILAIAGLLVPTAPELSHAQAVYSKDIYTGRYAEQGGEAVYRAICQGCHMPDGRGARGAATYPALAGNPHLAGAAYPASVIANGQRAMPWFGGPLTDQQIAEVATYVRTHFGNHYDTPVTPDEVAAVRRPHPGDGE